VYELAVVVAFVCGSFLVSNRKSQILNRSFSVDDRHQLIASCVVVSVVAVVGAVVKMAIFSEASKGQQAIFLGKKLHSIVS